MPKVYPFPIHLAILAGLAIAGQEHKLEPKEVPAAVTAAAAKQYPGARITAWSKEVEGGRTTYEASLSDQSSPRDVTFAEDGSLVAIEEAIAVSALPAAVKKTLDKKHPRATVKKAEKISHGSEIQYEVTLQKASKKEVLLTPDGKILKEE